MADVGRVGGNGVVFSREGSYRRFESSRLVLGCVGLRCRDRGSRMEGEIRQVERVRQSGAGSADFGMGGFGGDAVVLVGIGDPGTGA